MVEAALGVVKSEQKGPNPTAAGLVAKATDHTICRSIWLDFEHCPFSRLVRGVEPLGHDAIQPALTRRAKPLFGHASLAGHWRKDEPSADFRGIDEGLQRCSAMAKRCSEQVFAVRRDKGVEQDQTGRSFGGELADATLGRVKTRLQCVEGKLAPEFNDQLAIEDEAFRLGVGQYRDDFRKEATERLGRLGSEVDLRPRLEGQASEAVPFRSILPGAISVGEGVKPSVLPSAVYRAGGRKSVTARRSGAPGP